MYDVGQVLDEVLSVWRVVAGVRGMKVDVVRMKEKKEKKGKGRDLSTKDLRLLDGAISTPSVNLDGEIYHE